MASWRRWRRRDAPRACDPARRGRAAQAAASAGNALPHRRSRARSLPRSSPRCGRRRRQQLARPCRVARRAGRASPRPAREPARSVRQLARAGLQPAQVDSRDGGRRPVGVDGASRAATYRLDVLADFVQSLARSAWRTGDSFGFIGCDDAVRPDAAAARRPDAAVPATALAARLRGSDACRGCVCRRRSGRQPGIWGKPAHCCSSCRTFICRTPRSTGCWLRWPVTKWCRWCYGMRSNSGPSSAPACCP